MTGLLLIIGRNGQVARELVRVAEGRGLSWVSAGRETLDLARGDNIRSLIDRLQPAVVVNAAAYTAVEQAERNPEPAFRLNRDLPGALASACAERSLPFLHYSTDYVFDGSKNGPYEESDERRPLNVYGRSKAEGEDAVASAGGRWTILRTSWVYSASKGNFLTTMLRLARERESVRVVEDQIGRPTWARDCAEAALQVLSRGASPGVRHLAGAGEAVSWADFAEAIFADAAARGGRSTKVVRVSTKAYGASVDRPRNSCLDDSRLRGELGWGPAPWPEGLCRCLDEVFRARPAGDGVAARV